jgi:hypothetical protein
LGHLISPDASPVEDGQKLDGDRFLRLVVDESYGGTLEDFLTLLPRIEPQDEIDLSNWPDEATARWNEIFPDEVTYPRVTKLVVSSSDLWRRHLERALEALPNVTTLDLTGCSALMEGLPDLKGLNYLSVRNCSLLHASDIAALSQGNPNLRELDMIDIGILYRRWPAVDKLPLFAELQTVRAPANLENLFPWLAKLPLLDEIEIMGPFPDLELFRTFLRNTRVNLTVVKLPNVSSDQVNGLIQELFEHHGDSLRELHADLGDLPRPLRWAPFHDKTFPELLRIVGRYNHADTDWSTIFPNAEHQAVEEGDNE